MIEVECPCCQAALKVDPVTEAVISHTVPEKPREIENIEAAVARIKGEGARREEAFQKSFAAEKKSKDVLSKKFDELLKQAKDKPDLTRPVRDFDLD